VLRHGLLFSVVRKGLGSREQREYKTVNNSETSTNFVQATRSMRRIILIFVMCDLALASFAAHELLQESECCGAPECVDFCLYQQPRDRARQ
jgi:hypothetical protein